MSQSIRLNKKGKNICSGGGLRMSTEKAEVMPGWHDGAAPAQSQISPSPALCHTSICSSLSLFLPGSVLHSAQIKILSSICHIPGSAPAVSNDPLSPYSVTLQQYSVHPKQSRPLLPPSHPLPFFIFHLPILTFSPSSTHTLIQYSYFRGRL